MLEELADYQRGKKIQKKKSLLGNQCLFADFTN